MATEQQVRDAIDRVARLGSAASDEDKRLTEKAAKQQGSTGNDAKQAQGQKTTGLFG